MSWWRAAIDLETETLYFGRVWATSPRDARQRLRVQLGKTGKVAQRARWQSHGELLEQEDGKLRPPFTLPSEVKALREAASLGNGAGATVSDGKLTLYRNAKPILTVPDTVGARGILWAAKVRIRQPWVLGVDDDN